MIRWLDADFDDGGHGSDGDGGDPNQSEDDNGKTLGASVLDDVHVYDERDIVCQGAEVSPQKCHKQTNASFLANDLFGMVYIYHKNKANVGKYASPMDGYRVILYHIISMFTILLMEEIPNNHLGWC